MSWLSCAVLLVVVGCTVALNKESATWTRGLSAAVAFLGVSVATTTFRVELRLSSDTMVARNHIRKRVIPLERVTAVRSRVTATPLTRGVGWGQLEVDEYETRPFRIAATTGQKPETICSIVTVLASLAPSLRCDVDRTMFPTLRMKA